MKTKALLLLSPCVVTTIFLCAIWFPFVSSGKQLSDLQEMEVIIVFLPSVLTSISEYKNYCSLSEEGENLNGMIWKTLSVKLLTITGVIGTLCYAVSALNLWHIPEIKIVRFIIAIILVGVFFWLVLIAYLKIFAFISKCCYFELRRRLPLDTALINLPITAVALLATLLALKG